MSSKDVLLHVATQGYQPYIGQSTEERIGRPKRVLCKSSCEENQRLLLNCSFTTTYVVEICITI